jgi:rhamnulose-1-phosphate aldolase
MIPETKAFCPRGLGMVPYLMPSGVELAEATIKAIDQIDVLNKAALIYIASKNMGFEPEGMSDAQMQELTETVNLPK